MSSVHAPAMRVTSHPASVGLPENPNPGSDGMTTSKESAASPPNATGSVSGPINLRKSAIDVGHPCVRTRGSAPGFADLTWRKWMSSPSIVVRNCGKELSSDSKRRQSYSRSQYETSDLAFSTGTPCDQSRTVSRSGQRVLASRSLRSSISASGMATRNGRMSAVQDWMRSSCVSPRLWCTRDGRRCTLVCNLGPLHTGVQS